MKRSLAGFALSLSLISNVYAAGSVNLSIKAIETVTLKKVSGKKFEKTSSHVTGEMSVAIDVDGQRVSGRQGINESNTNNDLSLEITGQNMVRFIDTKEGIDQEVHAIVNQNFIKTIKGLTIDASTMEGLYAESLKKAGLDILKGLEVKAEDGEVASDIKSSELNCQADGSLLICNQTQELILNVTIK